VIRLRSILFKNPFILIYVSKDAMRNTIVESKFIDFYSKKSLSMIEGEGFPT
jgi:hypothetical protein